MIEPGTSVRVTVPATSANLGPGFDAFGLALDVRDEYALTVTAERAVTVTTSGEGAEALPTGADHLVARAVETGLAHAGVTGLGFHLECRNAVPQGRGMGSSAAAIVGGLALAASLCGDVDRPSVLADAAALEGHPDNVAAATYGGLTIAWTEAGLARAVALAVSPEVRLVLFVPDATNPTQVARAALPDLVRHRDAATNAGRAGLLVAALTARPELLLAATEDRLHQEPRRAAYPEAMELVDRLRDAGHAAVVSGAGPAVLVLTTQDHWDDVAGQSAPGYRTVRTSVGVGVDTP